MFNARRMLTDIAAEMIYFSAAAEDVPEVGVDLKVNLLADTSEPQAVEGGVS